MKMPERPPAGVELYCVDCHASRNAEQSKQQQ